MKPMEKLNAFLGRIPSLLSSKISIFIYLFLFVYLVLYAVLCLVIPALSSYAPSDKAQLILGNYTNVLSALGASIAAGAGTAAHASMKRMHQKHDALLERIEALHAKLDRLEQEKAARDETPRTPR